MPLVNVGALMVNVEELDEIITIYYPEIRKSALALQLWSGTQVVSGEERLGGGGGGRTSAGDLARKRWWLYILPQYLANLTANRHKESHILLGFFLAKFVPVLTTLCCYRLGGFRTFLPLASLLAFTGFLYATNFGKVAIFFRYAGLVAMKGIFDHFRVRDKFSVTFSDSWSLENAL